MTIFDNRPDPEYIRSLWRGDNPPRETRTAAVTPAAGAGAAPP